MSKKEFIILINEPSEQKTQYVYKYGNTKNIKLSISSNSAQIHFFQESLRAYEDVISKEDKLCVDMLKKIKMISLLLYGKSIKFNKIRVSINGKMKTVYKRNGIYDTLIWSMIPEKLDHIFPADWRDKEFIQSILSVPQSRFDGRHNALIDLSIAKSKRFQSEKTMYLWMSMNGFYNYLASEYYKIHDLEQSKKDIKKQNIMCRILGMSTIPKIILPGKDVDSSQDIFRKKMIVLAGNANKEKFTRMEDLYEGVISMAESYGLPLQQDQLKPLMLIWLPYQIRCNYFHANIGMPIFVHRDDTLLNAFEFINNYLENWLESELPKWLKSNELSEEQQKMIALAKQ